MLFARQNVGVLLTAIGIGIGQGAYAAPNQPAARGNDGEPKAQVGNPKAKATLQGHADEVSCMAFSPDGKTLASGGEHEVKIWDLATGKVRAVLPGHPEAVSCVAFSPDGKILASATIDHTVIIWDVGSGTRKLQERTTIQGRKFVCHLEFSPDFVAFSPDGKTLAFGSRETVKLWDVATGQERAALEKHQRSVCSVAFSPDGKTLAFGCKDQTVKLWELATGKERASLAGHAVDVSCVAFSPDGKLLASGGHDRAVKIWDLATGKESGSLRGITDEVRSVAFSPDGKTLASVREDCVVQFWDPDACVERPALLGHVSAARSVAYSPDGKTLASGEEGGKVKLWDLPATEKTGLRSRTIASRQAALLTFHDLDGLWTALAGDNATKAYQAIGTLAGAPDQAVLLVKEQVRPVANPDPQAIARAISELDSDQFTVREKATAELEKTAGVAAALRTKLAEKPSLEVQRRIEKVLSKIDGEQVSSQALPGLRAVEVLERVNSAAGRKVLESLASGAESARLTQDASAALDRLKRRRAADR